MNLYQVTAYVAFDRIMVQATRCETTEDGRQWAHMVLEDIALPGGSDEPWDVLWAVGQELCEQALRRGGRQ